MIQSTSAEIFTEDDAGRTIFLAKNNLDQFRAEFVLGNELTG